MERKATQLFRIIAFGSFLSRIIKNNIFPCSHAPTFHFILLEQCFQRVHSDCAIISESQDNKGTLTLTVWPEAPLQHLGSCITRVQSCLQPSRFLLKGKSYRHFRFWPKGRDPTIPSRSIPVLELLGSSLPLVEDPRYCPSRKWASNGHEPCAGNSFSGA